MRLLGGNPRPSRNQERVVDSRLSNHLAQMAKSFDDFLQLLRRHPEDQLEAFADAENIKLPPIEMDLHDARNDNAQYSQEYPPVGQALTVYHVMPS